MTSKRITDGADRILQSIQNLSEHEGKTALTIAIMAVIASTSDNVDERRQQIRILCGILTNNLDQDDVPTRGEWIQ